MRNHTLAYFQQLGIVALVTIFATSCRDSTSEPPQAPFGMTLMVAEDRIRVGEYNTIMLLIHNSANVTRRLPSNSCVFRAEIRSQTEIVASVDAVCAQPETFLTYPPGQSRWHSFEWYGRTSFDNETGAPVDPGTYEIRGSFNYDGGRFAASKTVTVIQ